MISYQNELIMMMMSAMSYCLPTQFPVLKMNFYQVFEQALKFYQYLAAIHDILQQINQSGKSNL